MSFPIPVILCLSQDGTHFDLKVNAEGFRNVTASDSVHTYLRNATKCDSHEAVVDFLRGLKSIKDANFKPYHFDDPHHYHHYVKSIAQPESKLKIDGTEAHWCDVADMINFAILRMEHRLQPAKL